MNLTISRDHLRNLAPQVENGFWALLDEPYREGSSMKISGSAILANAVSKEEVLEVLKRDVYSTSGIWDWSKVQIYPFKSAVRKAL
ncbi:hypothetical protein MMC20_005933 [Loxospora ochrophaea]|nr:hypothetical protein [Loxospora ochrophaea]